MSKNNFIPVVWALALCAALGAGQVRGAQAKSEDDDYRVMSMGADPAEKSAPGAKTGSGGEWEAIFKANNHDKLTANDRQIQKAEFAEDFDEDMLDQSRRLDWYGASEDCAEKGGLPTHKELLNIWNAECKESTSAVCSAVYWTSEKGGERALCVNFLNGYVVAQELDAFAYVRCAGGKTGRKPAAPRAAREKEEKKKVADPSAKIVDFVLNYRPVPDGPRLQEKLDIMIAGAGGSAGAVSWEVRRKKAGWSSAEAVVPVGEGDIKFTFNVNLQKKAVTPVDARAKAVFKAITDPDVADGEMR